MTPYAPMHSCRLIQTFFLTLQLRLRPLVQQVVHLPPWPVWVQTRRRSLTVPSPLLLELRREVIFQHLNDVLSEDWEELVAVE
jgi:hypothetical protein